MSVGALFCTAYTKVEYPTSKSVRKVTVEHLSSAFSRRCTLWVDLQKGTWQQWVGLRLRPHAPHGAALQLMWAAHGSSNVPSTLLYPSIWCIHGFAFHPFVLPAQSVSRTMPITSTAGPSCTSRAILRVIYPVAPVYFFRPAGDPHLQKPV